MSEFAKQYPGLNLEHVRALAALVAAERNAVATVTAVYAHARWGIACLAYQVVKDRIEEVVAAGTYDWLDYVREPGLAYTVLVDGVPLRIQPESDDIRDVMPGERSALAKVQTVLDFGAKLGPRSILRLEVTQASGKPVERIALYLIGESSETIHDIMIAYDSQTDAASLRDTSGTVTSLARPPQDVDTSALFAFPANDADESNDSD